MSVLPPSYAPQLGASKSLPPLPTQDCEALLQPFLDGPCRVNAAVLATVDGRLVAMARRIAFDEGRIAAISGSMLALAEACARELGQSACRNAIVDSGQGLTVVLRVNAPRGGWVLTTMGASDTNLGLLFTHSRQLAERLGEIAQRSAGTALPSTTLPTSLKDPVP